jgi:hypothetical protein
VFSSHLQPIRSTGKHLLTNKDEKGGKERRNKEEKWGLKRKK